MSGGAKKCPDCKSLVWEGEEHTCPEGAWLTGKDEPEERPSALPANPHAAAARKWRRTAPRGVKGEGEVRRSRRVDRTDMTGASEPGDAHTPVTYDARGWADRRDRSAPDATVEARYRDGSRGRVVGAVLQGEYPDYVNRRGRFRPRKTRLTKAPDQGFWTSSRMDEGTGEDERPTRDLFDLIRELDARDPLDIDGELDDEDLDDEEVARRLEGSVERERERLAEILQGRLARAEAELQEIAGHLVGFPAWAEFDPALKGKLSPLLRRQSVLKLRAADTALMMDALTRQGSRAPEHDEPESKAGPPMCSHCHETVAFTKGLCTACYRYYRRTRTLPDLDVLRERRWARDYPITQ